MPKLLYLFRIDNFVWRGGRDRNNKKSETTLEDRASLMTVQPRVSSDFLDSSSMSMILLLRAEMSPSTSLNILSFSSRDSAAF